MSVRELRRRPLWMVAGALVASLTVILAGCSSSGGSKSGNTTGSSTAASSGGSTDPGLAAAEAFIKPYLNVPASIPITTPLKTKPTPGKTLVWTNCEAEQCGVAAKFLKEATDAVGWNLKIINYKTSDPSTLIAAMKQALLFHPVATMLVALPQAVWAPVIPLYKAAGVGIIPWNVGPVTVDGTVLTQLPALAVATKWGEILANYFIADSKGKGEVILYTVPTFATVTAVTDGFQATVKQNCPACIVHVVTQDYSDVAAGKASSAVVAAFQRNRNSKYLVSGEIALNQGIATALTSAGISGVKISGYSADAAEETLVKSGAYQMIIPNGSNIFNWLMVDSALRKDQGLPPVDISAINNYIYTKDSPLAPDDTFAGPTDWQEQFKKLWLVG